MKFRGNTDAEIEVEARAALRRRLGGAEGEMRTRLLDQLRDEARQRLPSGFSQSDQGYARSMGYNDDPAKMTAFDALVKRLVEDELNTN